MSNRRGAGVILRHRDVHSPTHREDSVRVALEKSMIAARFLFFTWLAFLLLLGKGGHLTYAKAKPILIAILIVTAIAVYGITRIEK